jgi:hypothetical protein
MAEKTEITVLGCIKKGVEAGCIILTAQGKEYSLHGKSLPTLGKGLGVSVTGTTGGSIIACRAPLWK